MPLTFASLSNHRQSAKRLRTSDASGKSVSLSSFKGKASLFF